MSANTKIEWADHTFNPWEGCQKVGPGCDHCYAEARNARFSGGTAINWGPGAPRRRTSESNWKQPVKWNAEAQRLGIRYRVFCASLADVFDNEVPQEWRDDLFDLIAKTPNLDWLLLTKRIGNVGNMLPVPFGFDRLYPNVWLGATIVNQAEADRDIPKLLQVPARVRFLSMEPLLGPVDLLRVQWPATHRVDVLRGGAWDVPGWHAGFTNHSDMPGTVDWVIVGGESGPGARPMHPDWARSLRDQCQAAGVPFLFKQWGEWLPLDHQRGGADPEEQQCYIWPDGRPYDSEHEYITPECVQLSRVGKKAAGRLLDGHTWDEVPTP